MHRRRLNLFARSRIQSHMIRLQDYTADHRYLLDVAARDGGLIDPVALDLDEFAEPLLKASRRGEFMAIDGMLVRDWDPANRRSSAGLQLGMRLYEIEGLRFVQVLARHADTFHYYGLSFVAVSRRDYRRLYKIALRCRRDAEPPAPEPVLPPGQADLLWKNTVGYLETFNLERIRQYGGRPRRGVLLTGSPGNGKTMACRWLWEACRKRNFEYKIVTPDEYRQARNSCAAAESVRELFTLERRGLVLFDDMDIALRDREVVKETEDQAVFLTALDGLSIKEGIVFVFTTNCALELIDRAFKRPGRIDLVLQFEAPAAELRRRLFERWHADIRAVLDLDRAVADTQSFSFAEIDELKNLLILHFMDTGIWDWPQALRQFSLNRAELSRRHRHIGFGTNGHAELCAR